MRKVSWKYGIISFRMKIVFVENNNETWENEGN